MANVDHSGTSPKPRAADRRSMVMIAYETIKARILDNSFVPGEQVLEGELSDQLGMS